MYLELRKFSEGKYNILKLIILPIMFLGIYPKNIIGLKNKRYKSFYMKMRGIEITYNKNKNKK